MLTLVVLALLSTEPSACFIQSPGVFGKSANIEKMTDGGYALDMVCTAGCGSSSGTGSGDGKILDGTAAGQADVIGSAPAGTEQGLVVRNIPSGTQPVSGTFWQATQPVSGTFWQATQPVSGPLTDTQLRASAVPVSGTFWQATQPVSGTFWQATQPVSGTFWPTTAASPLSSRLSDGAAFYVAAKAGDNMGRSWTLASGTDSVTAVPQTLTKGTQGSVGFTTQSLIDSGRTLITFTADNVTPVLTTDTVVTFTKLVGDTSTGAVTTYAVTSGKTLRITSLSFSMVPNSTTVAYLRVRLRTNSAGACTASSTLVGVWGASSPPGTIAANAGGVLSVVAPFPDGMEFSGATRNLCLSMNVLGAAAQTVNITVTGFEY